jgi:Uma2 family endonuclease
MRRRSAYIGDMESPLVTADELLRIGVPGKRTELIRGRLVVREPAGFRHGVVAMEIGRRLSEFVRAGGLGIVVAAETGFKLASDPDTVRAPDAAFISHNRVPSPLPRGYADFPLDLAVEVLSPDDRPGEVLAKVSDWLTSGARLVWVLDPERRVARVYRADGSESIVPAAGALDGEDVLPGFHCNVGDVL